MKDMHTLEGCLELEFTLQKTLLKVTSMCMELGEEQAAQHTKTGPVTSATGEFVVELADSSFGLLYSSGQRINYSRRIAA